eukprot:GHVR01127324.1.p1 GENE.GHVR01127324.1~~GHVR01127324.1.p1  ORF type:complete len:118 (-),score=7.64 GHVR01127324.1:245-598(-)
MSSLARIIETNLALDSIATSDSGSTDPVSLDGADKYSVEITAIDGDIVAHLEASNSVATPDSDTVWTEIDSVDIAADASDMFEVSDASYRWVRITIENDDVSDVGADNRFLVIGDAV